MSMCEPSKMLLLKLEELIQGGDMHDYQAYLERAKRLGLQDEVAEAENKLEMKRAEVSRWLTQAVQDWIASRATIDRSMEEAKRLGMEEITSMTEAALSAREKLVTEAVEISIAEGLKFSFDKWTKHARNMGMEELVARSQAAFLEKVDRMRGALMEAATSGTKQEFLAASEKAKSLGLHTDVARGSSIVRKRVSDVMSVVIGLVRNGLSHAEEWDNIRVQTQGLGIGWDVVENLGQNVIDSEGGNNDQPPTPVLRKEEQEHTTSTSKPSSDVNLGAARNDASVQIPLWSMMQNWKQTEIIRRKWQKYMASMEDSDRRHAEADTFEGDVTSVANSVGGTLGSCDDSKMTGHILRDQPDAESDSGEGQLVDNSWTQPSRADENEEMADVLSIPLMLTALTMEQKMNCPRTELQWLTRLDLNNEGLSELGHAVISESCPTVKAVSCDMNRLTTLKGAFLGCEEGLESISARNNFIADISDLEGLPRLEILRLDGNNLSSLWPCERKSRGLTGWPKMKELHLSCNRITKLSPLGSLCPKLQVLDLGSNHLVSLRNALAGLKSLRMLDVGQNRLTGRSLWDDLRHCPLLIALVASRNQLTELPTFHGSVLLRELWLNGNVIKRLSCSAWMPNLQRLYLQDNSIETLEPLWGCPALEVLDLSFNSISELSQLRQLACFIHLRSLQLNDNPVSEQTDYTDTVLESVPWLMELDNEAVTERCKNRVVRRIFTDVMKHVGMQYLQEKAARQEIITSNNGKPNEIHRVLVGCDPRKLSWFHRLHHDSINPAGGKTCSEVPLRKFHNASAERAILWSALVEAGLLDSTRSALRSLSRARDEKGLDFSDDMEAKQNVFAMQEICSRQRDKLLLANKDLATVSRDVSRNEVEACSGQPCLDSSVQLATAELNACIGSGRGFDGLELCLQQHLRFCGHSTVSRQEVKIRKLQSCCRDYLSRLKLRRREKAARKVQTVWKRWKIRCRYNLWSDAESRNAGIRLIVKVQAAWRGHIFRQKYRSALAKSKYIDEDRFDYGAIDEEEFASEVPDITLGPEFSANDCPSSVSDERGDSFLRIVADDQTSGSSWDNDSVPLAMADNDVHQGQEHKRMQQIAEEWGFKDEKTVKQFLKACNKVKRTQKASKQPAPADSQKRLEMFKAKPDSPTEHSQLRQHLENMFASINRRSNTGIERENGKSPAEVRKPPKDAVKAIVYPFAVPSH